MSANKLQKLKEQKNSSPNDIQLMKNIKREQIKVGQYRTFALRNWISIWLIKFFLFLQLTQLRELQTQLNVEEVIRGQTMKVYNERCRSYYKPSKEEAQSINFRDNAPDAQ